MKFKSHASLTGSAVVLISLMAVVPAIAQNNSSDRATAILKPQSGEGPVAPSIPAKHLLIGTFFDTSSPGASASCSSAHCTAFAPMYSEAIVCPKAAGLTCTFQITIQSQNAAGSNDLKFGEEGVYQFLVDGVAPTPGPVASSCACYTWSGASHLFSLTVRATSYAVTATVKNATASQSHSIGVNIGCVELQGNTTGCFAKSGFANLSVAMYAP